MDIEMDYSDTSFWKSLLIKLTASSTKSNLHQMIGILNEFAYMQKSLILNGTIKNFNESLQIFYIVELQKELIKRVLDIKQSSLQENVKQILQNCLQIYFRFYENRNLKISEWLDTLLDFRRDFYQLKINSLEQQLEIYNDLDFLNSLREGDLIDVASQREETNLRHWICARVHSINENNIQAILEDNYKEIFALDWKIQPHKSRCKNYQWRMGLKVGDHIDAFEWKKQSWIQSTVQQRLEETLSVKIGYRIYQDQNQQDTDGDEKYIGFRESFDQIIPLLDPKIREYKSLSKKFTKKSYKKLENKVVNDSNDLLFLLENQKSKIFVITRQNQPINQIYFTLINQFGKLGGFSILLQNFTQSDLSAEQLDSGLNLLFILHNHMFRIFAQEFVPKLIKKIEKICTNPNENLMRGLNRDRINNILENLNYITRRYFNPQQRKQWREKIFLELVASCIKSKFLERKIQGLKFLEQLIKDCKYSRLSIQTQDFNKWLVSQNLISEIYQETSHLQVMSRSYDIFRYIVEDVPQCFQQFWKLALSENIQVKEILYKFLNDGYRKINRVHRSYIIDHLNDVKASDINQDFIEFLKELHTQLFDEQRIKMIDYLWKLIISHSNQFKSSMKQKCCEILIFVIRDLSFKAATKKMLFIDALKLPLSNTIISIFSEVFSYNISGQTQLAKQYIEHIVNSLADFPVSKYSKLKNIFDLLIEFEENTGRISQTMEDIIIKSIKPEGIIHLLNFLLKRNSHKLVYPQPNHLNQQSFKLLVEIFQKNEMKINCNFTELPFYAYLIQIIESQECKVRQPACQFIVNLYVLQYQQSILDQQHQKIEKTKNLNDFLNKCLEKNSYPYYMIMRMIIQHLEADRSHLTFSNISSSTHEILITFINDSTSHSMDSTRSFCARTTANNSVRWLFQQAAQRFHYSIYQLKLLVNRQEILFSNSIKTLQQIRLKSTVIINCTKKYEFKKTKLVIKGRLISQATKIFKNAYLEFSPGKQMTKSQFENYYERYSSESMKPDPYKLDRIFKKYDTNQDEKLSLEQFIKYITAEAEEKQYQIWGYLDRMGYHTNFKKKKPCNEENNQKIYPSTLLQMNKNLYQQLFENIRSAKNLETEKEIFTLILRLETKLTYFEKKIEDQIKDLLNQTNIFIIWYKLTTIKYITKQYMSKEMTLNISEEMQRHWRTAIRNQGVQILVSSLKTVYFEKKIATFHERCLETLLKILKQLLIEKSEKVYYNINKLLPSKEDTLSDFTFFVPDVKCPQISFEKSFNWLLPQKSFLIRINQLIFQIYMIQIIMYKVNGWELLKEKWSQSSKLKKLQSWCFCLTVWMQKFPEDGCKTLFQNKQYELCAFMIQKYDYVFTKEYESLSELIINQLINHKSTQIMNKTQKDQELIGMTKILIKIFENHQELAIKYVYVITNLLQKHLFWNQKRKLQQIQSIQNQDIVNFIPGRNLKFFSHESRKLAYYLVTSITKLLPEIVTQIFFDFINKFIHLIPKPIEKPNLRCSLGYLGLKNLGSTCYMNSILQQLFQNQKLRLNISSVKSQDIFLTEFQRLFTYLHFSDRLDFNPSKLFSHVKIGGRQTPPNQQQDAHQFLNFLFQRLEKALDKTNQKHLIRSIYGGNFITLITCMGCNEVRQVHQNFYDLSLEIKQKKTLYDSLDRLIQGEIITEFMCEKCKNKQNLHKRTVLDQLPDELIIHLQRLGYDFDINSNRKIHSRLEFPEMLDLRRYCKNQMHKPQRKISISQEEVHINRSNNQFLYKLKGVIIHSGTAEGGHYYSLIREKNDWLLFNDSQISEFQGIFQEDCYGGITNADQWQIEQYSKSAYMLVYQRIREREDVDQKKDQENQNSNVIKQSDNKLVNTTEKYEQKSHSPIKIIKKITYNNREFLKEDERRNILTLLKDFWWEICLDNEQLFVERIIFEDQFYYFISRLYSHLPIMSYNYAEIETYQIAIRFLDCLIFQTGNSVEVNSVIVTQLNRLVKIIPQKCFEILEKRADIKYLIGNFPYLNLAIKDLYVTCINLAIEQNQSLPDLIKKFIENILKQLNLEIAKNSHKSTECIQLIRDILKNEVILKYLMQKDIISILIDFIMEKQSPISLCQKKYSLGSKFSIQSVIISIITILNRCRKSNNIIQIKQNINNENDILELSDNAKKCLQSQDFFKKIIKDKTSLPYIGGIIQYLCYNNKDFSLKLSKIILKALGNSYSSQDVIPYVNVIRSYLNIDDQLKRIRCLNIIGFPELHMNSEGSFALITGLHNQVYHYPTTIRNDNSIKSILDLIYKDKLSYQTFVVVGINMVVSLCLENEFIFEYMIRIPSPTYIYGHYFEWMEDFLLNFVTESHKYKSSDLNLGEYGQKTYQLYNQLCLKIKKYIESQQKKQNMIQIQNEICKTPFSIYLYGTTFKVIKVKEIEINQKLTIIFYDNYVHKTISLPNKNYNKVFPRYLLDAKGRFQKQQFAKYQNQVEKYIQTELKLVNGHVKMELLPETNDQETNGISFSPVFKTQHKIQKTLLPNTYQIKVDPPEKDYFEIIRTFYIANASNNKYQLLIRAIKQQGINVMDEIIVSINKQEIILAMVSLKQHDIEVSVLESIQDWDKQNVQKMIVNDSTMATAMMQNGFDEDKIRCKHCTYMNPLTVEKCEVCDQNLFD